jgi:hypothetical protein
VTPRANEEDQRGDDQRPAQAGVRQRTNRTAARHDVGPGARGGRVIADPAGETRDESVNQFAVAGPIRAIISRPSSDRGPGP